MRVPCIMRWPGQIPAGTTCSEVAGTIDLMPTFAALSQAEMPTDRVTDGHDIWPLLAGTQGAKSPHDAYYYYRGTNLEAVREGDWKLRIAKKDKVELFNLADDISESNNLAEENPQKVAHLRELMRDFDRDLRANSRPIGKRE